MHRPPRGRSRAAATCAAAVLLFLPGCSENTTAPPLTADHIEIRRPRLPIVLIGDSLRLAALATNASGGVIGPSAITWTSSAEAVATVRDDGTVFGHQDGDVLITARADAVTDTVTLQVAAGAVVGREGGTASAEEGRVSLVVPEMVLLDSTFVTIRPVDPAETGDRVVAAYRVFAEGRSIYPSVLSVRVDENDIPPGLTAQSLQLYWLREDGWWPNPSHQPGATDGVVSGTISLEGVFAVRSTPVDSIELTQAPTMGVLFAGRSAPIEVTVRAGGWELEPRPQLDWSSSDPTVLDVNNEGVVTGKAPGEAQVIARIDGRELRIPLTVLPAPTPDWSRARDWSTYQGNPQHNAFVDAVLDRDVFAEAWASEPLDFLWIHPATTGGGDLFLATEEGAGSQSIIRVEQATGQTLDVLRLGVQERQEQPTFADGKLVLHFSGGWSTASLALVDLGTMQVDTVATFSSETGRWPAPLVTTSAIIASGSAGVHGFGRSGGPELYHRATASAQGWAPSLGLDGRLYVVDGGVTALDAATGAELADLRDARLGIPSTPVMTPRGSLLTISEGGLFAVDTRTMRSMWDRSGDFSGLPVANEVAVFAARGATVEARSELNGDLLWSWEAPEGVGSPRVVSLLATRNLLFVGVQEDYGPGATYALDLDSQTMVWSHPMGGHLALSPEGYLFVTWLSWIAAVDVR